MTKLIRHNLDWGSNRTGATGRALLLASAGLSALLGAAAGAAEEVPGDTRRPDKSQYHLFNPTPRELMRELDTDRPDQTETSISVDAGHFQVEADLFTYSYSDQPGTQEQFIAAPTLNLKIGLLNQMDLQVVLNPYNRLRVRDLTTNPETVTTRSGFGDMQVRTKVNLWGNDGGSTALAMMPFIHLPTGREGLSRDAVEGGVIFPFSFELPAGFDATLMGEADFLRNAADDGYHTDFVQSLAVGRDLTEKFSVYVELFTIVSTETGTPWMGQLGLGANYLVTKDLKLDAGINIGVTDSAPDWGPFVGVTWRY